MAQPKSSSSLVGLVGTSFALVWVPSSVSISYNYFSGVRPDMVKIVGHIAISGSEVIRFFWDWGPEPNPNLLGKPSTEKSWDLVPTGHTSFAIMKYVHK